MTNLFKIYLIFILYCYRLLTWIFCMFLHKKNSEKGILFLENFPVENAGSQYRAYKWKQIFESRGLRCEVKTIFENKDDFEAQFKNMPLLFIRAIRKKFRQCLYAQKFNTVIVRRELLQFNDYGNLFMEKFLLKIHPNVILDFDDDIAEAKKEPRKITNLYGKLMQENGNKFNDSLRLYHKFVVGNEYLKQKVLNENKNISENKICIIPTCVDYDIFPAKVYNLEKKEIIIGWIGGNHNLHYLDMLVEPLNKLVKDFNFKLVVCAGSKYFNAKAKYPIENCKWSLAEEKNIIRNFDIGLMPIKDNAIGRGKCGFKLLQYMGMGVIGVATDVAINGEIIKDGENGFLVKSDNSNWYDVLKKVLSLQNKHDVGINARKTVIENFTFNANVEKYERFLGFKK